LICLFFEVLKSTNTGRSSVIERMLSTVVFVVFLVEFLLVRSRSKFRSSSSPDDYWQSSMSLQGSLYRSPVRAAKRINELT